MSAQLSVVYGNTPVYAPVVIRSFSVDDVCRVSNIIRLMREIGLRVERVIYSEGAPQVRLAWDEKASYVPLLDLFHGTPRFHSHEDGVEVWGEVEGVTVCFRHPHAASWINGRKNEGGL